ncbi:MAG TPA: BON domain-containing protein [Candidatus Angelobacter sp.]|nr:BON domain-containing protein [Candidatus Angelobacter sp.]
MRRYFWVGIVSLGLIAAGCTRLGGHTDQQVAADVQTKINADASFPDKQLNVTSANGVVTLSGTVSSDAARAAAAADAAQVDGVKTVVNNLVVATPDLAGMQADAQTPAPQKAPALRAAAIKPSPRSNRASRSYDQAPSTQNGNSGDSGLRTTVPANSGGDSVATSAPPAPTPVPKVTIPVGTQLSIRLTEELSSEKAQVGDVFHGSISAPITVDDQTVVPTTADVEGRVVDVKSAGRFAGKSDLVLQLTKLTMNGKSYSIQTDQWNKDGSARGKATAAKVGGGAAVGAILGGIFGGGKGAAIGAAAGAGAGTGVSAATKGQQVVLKPEAVINFTLQSALTVTPGAQRQSMNQ